MNSDIKRYTIETNEITPFYKWIEDNKEVIVIKHKNEIKVFDSVCPHFGGRLEFDNKDNAKLVCPFHGIKFDIKTCLGTNRIYKKVKKYKIISQNPLVIEG